MRNSVLDGLRVRRLESIHSEMDLRISCRRENSVVKGRRVERNEKLCVISVQVMVYGMTGDKVTERCGVENE